MNSKIICTACGTQYTEPAGALSLCPVCADDRQYIPETGQGWTSLDELNSSYSIITKKINEQLYELKMVPLFGIGQRALLVITPGGNILWDCIALLNEPIINFINARGGLKAIAFSHPHYYSTMNDWAQTFKCPVYIHEKDNGFIFNKGRYINTWNGTTKELWDGINIINVGGHFPGSSILHVPFLSTGGTVLCGDTFYVSPSKKHMAVMYSYPNRIPLPLYETERIKKQMLSMAFDTLYGFYDYQNICGDAKIIMEQSLGKYTM